MINLTSGYLSFKLNFVKWFDKTGAPQTLLSADIGANLFVHILIATEKCKIEGDRTCTCIWGQIKNI